MAADTTAQRDVETASVAALVLDLLEWVGEHGRGYQEVMEAWRTTCPRLSVWEDACTLGYVEVQASRDRGRVVLVTPAGRSALRRGREPDRPRVDRA